METGNNFLSENVLLSDPLRCSSYDSNSIIASHKVPAMTNLKGLVTFLTGGSSGLGKATLNHLLRLGGKVYSYDVQNFPDQIEEEKKEDVLFMKADIRDEKCIKQALEECHSRFGRIDALVNCAGVGIAFFVYNPLKERSHSFRDFNDLIDINVYGTYNVIRHGVSYLARNKYSKEEGNEDDLCGTIITTSGIAAANGVSGQTSYSAACGAVESMVAPLAKDFAKNRIRCMNIQVGYFDTPVFNRSQEDIKEYLSRYCTSPKRLGKAEEYAKLVETILANKFLNCSSITLDADNKLHIFSDVFSREKHRKLPYGNHLNR